MTDNTELKRLAQRVIDIEALDGGEPIGEAWGEFEAAATPAAVLALIAENKKLFRLLERTVAQHVPLTELEGVPGWSRAVELVEVVAERDQLKAENDLLRKLASDTGHELKKASSWICREVEAGTKSATHWAVRLREKADQIDAAMGKGEQS